MIHPAWEALPDETMTALAAMADAALASALLDTAPKASAADVAEAMRAMGRELTKRQAREYRDRWVERRAVAPHASADPDPIPPAAKLKDALIRAIDVGDMVTVGRVLAAMKLLPPEMAAKAEDTGEDWSRLTDAQAGMLAALVRVLHGEPTTSEDETWLGLLA